MSIPVKGERSPLESSVKYRFFKRQFLTTLTIQANKTRQSRIVNRLNTQNYSYLRSTKETVCNLTLSADQCTHKFPIKLVNNLHESVTIEIILIFVTITVVVVGLVELSGHLHLDEVHLPSQQASDAAEASAEL